MTKIQVLICNDSKVSLQYAKAMISPMPYIYEKKSYIDMLKSIKDKTKVIILDNIFKPDIDNLKVEQVVFLAKNFKDTGFTVSDIDSKKIDILHLS